MQKKVQIISDGSQDLSPELSKEKDIEVVPFYVSFDGEHYYKEIEEITVRDFYQQMVSKRQIQAIPVFQWVQLRLPIQFSPGI